VTTIEAYLRSEKKRLEGLASRLEGECDVRPRGALAVKTRGAGKYLYIIRREEGKVVTEYVGKLGTWKAHAAEAKVAERRRYQDELRFAMKELARIKRMLRAGGAFSD
jgi:hypothetical protein